MYGYNDYEGPIRNNHSKLKSTSIHSKEDETKDNPNDNHDDDLDDPLRVGLWMEGDSLAPPCGASIQVIHSMLHLANLSSHDVLYDLGCGDGRICLEAFFHDDHNKSQHDQNHTDKEEDNTLSFHPCQHCVGVEIEEDLVQRFRFLIQTSKQQEAQHNIPSWKHRTIEAIQEDLCSILKALVHLYANDPYTANHTPPNTSHPKSTSTATIRTAFTSLPRPTLITLYLLPESIEKIQPQLISLMKHNKDLQIICNTWGLKGIPPAKTLEVTHENESATITLYNYDSLRKG